MDLSSFWFRLRRVRVLQRIRAEHPHRDAPGPEQASDAIARAHRILEQEGARYGDTVRIWFYLEEILPWYGRFNRARTTAYDELGLSGDRLPASTGVSAVTPGGAAVSLDLLAITRHEAEDGPKVERLTNRAQLEAPRYGSSFSRAVHIRHGDAHLLELSGTAAIDRTGRTIRPDSAKAQVAATFDNIDSLLHTQGATLANMAAATVFLKSGADAPLFWEALQRRGLETGGWVCVQGDLCRPDLLFEIDGELVW